ncbi:MAG: D-alanyl-D-alanine carboxypeptidase [Verrucomicrobiota bacterium]|nr:D-alanyl-D-alanine carboxypeptidase [Verrucomicrobiota bacterium]
MRLIIWCLSFFSIALVAAPLSVEVQANAAILLNAETGVILYEKEAYTQAYPASITKIATALFLLDQKKLPLDQKVTVSHEAVRLKPVGREATSPSYWQEVDGTSMHLAKGEVVTVEALLHGLLLCSGNDAANALAEAASGSVPQFIEELNQYIRQQGCLHTQFQNPHGLHHPEHLTTAYDMGRLAMKAFQIPTFREIIIKQGYVKSKTNKQPQTELKQFNRLVLPDNKYFYPKAIGGKTGYHSAASNTLVAAATHEGRTLVAVLIGSPKRHERCFNDAKRLFETAFAETKQHRLLLSSTEVYHKNIQGAKGGALKASLAQDLSISYYPSEEPQTKAFIHWNPPALPIQKGEKVGEICLFDERGALLSKGDLLANELVEPTLLFVLQETWHKIFR